MTCRPPNPAMTIGFIFGMFLLNFKQIVAAGDKVRRTAGDFQHHGLVLVTAGEGNTRPFSGQGHSDKPPQIYKSAATVFPFGVAADDHIVIGLYRNYLVKLFYIKLLLSLPIMALIQYATSTVEP